MKLLASLLLVAGLRLSDAACPNKCSGHGTCAAADTCECQTGYTGVDCSQRECKYGLSWTAEIGDDDMIPAGRGLGGYHAYTECSSAGTCNRGTGLCECYDGYTGSACRRTTCPNDCSNHGRCLSLRQTNSSYVAYHAAQFASQYWDANMTRACSCDPGWSGKDCSAKMCPKGDDPMTSCSTDPTTFQGSAHEQIQRIYVVHKSSTSHRCSGANASTATKAASLTPPGIRTYSSCWFGDHYVDENVGDLTNGADQTAIPITVAVAAEATPSAILENVDYVAQGYKYVTVYDDVTKTSDTVKISSVASSSGVVTATVDQAWGGELAAAAVTGSVHGIILSKYPGLKGQDPIVNCPVDGPFAYQDQTDGRRAGTATRAMGGCEPNDPGQISVGGNQLGYIALTYTDMFGSKYTTRPILIDSTRQSTQDADAAGLEKQYSANMLMGSYSKCFTDFDCRGQAGITAALAATGTHLCSGADLTTTPPTMGTCTDHDTPGASHPHFEGRSERGAFTTAEPCPGAAPGTDCGTAAAPRASLTGGTAGVTINFEATTKFVADELAGYYMHIAKKTDNADNVAGTECGPTYFTSKSDGCGHASYYISANTNAAATIHYIPGSGKDVSASSDLVGMQYYITQTYNDNYDSFRAPTRLTYTADRIRQALQELPNFAIPTVNVTNHRRLDDNQYMGNVFDVTFTDAATSGKQPLLECLYSTDYNKPGAWPKMGNTPSSGVYATDTTVESCIVQEIYTGTGQYEENVECSNRGECDTGSGTCSCFEGFTGEACQEQTIFF